MDKIKAFLSDKKNTPIVGAVAGIVLVLVVLFYLKQFGIIGGGGAGNEFTDPAATDSATTQSTPAPTDAGVPPGPTSPTGTGTDAAAAPTPAASAGAAKIPPMFPYRKDPFMGFSGVPTTKDLMMTMLPNVRRVRLAPARLVDQNLGSGPVEEPMPPQPMRRVAGIMWGSTVKAIIESGGKTYIVVPGQQIPDERVRVESIEPSGVILSTLDTKRPMFIRVNLAGSPAAQAQADAGANMGNEAPPNTNYNRGGGRGRGGGAFEEAPPPGF